MSLINDPSGFEVTTSFEGPKAVLALRGRVESLAAFDSGRPWRVPLICSEGGGARSLRLDFIGAAGLVALANAEKSFAEAGVELTVRAPSPTAGATSWRHGAGSKWTVLDQALARLGHPGRERAGGPSHPPPIAPWPIV